MGKLGLGAGVPAVARQVLRSTAPVFDLPQRPAPPAGTEVFALVPLAHPAPGKTAMVIDTTEAGDVRLRTETDFIAHVKPDWIAPVSEAADVDTDPF